MLTGLANYLFGLNEFTDEVLENLLKETPIKGADGDDWILVELRQQLDSNGSNVQSIGCPDDIEPGKGGLTSSKSNKLPEVEDKGYQQGASNEDSLTDHKQSTNEESVSEENNNQSTANYPIIDNNEESEENEEDGEENDEEEDENDQDGEEIDSIINNNDANKQETANRRSKRKSRENSNNTGTMEGSWFMTPPPCFVSHKKSITNVSASPLEDILIEHPSISVFHSHTSSSLDSFYPIPPQLSPSNTKGLPSSSQHSPCPTLHLLPSPGLRFADLTSLATVAVSSIVALATPPASSNRSNRSNRGQRNGSSSNNRNNNNNNNRLNDEAIQPPRAGETRGANLENHERNGYLNEITNHHLAPMQKAMNQGSQKYLKKSFLNRQNLVKIQSNRRPTRRQRCTQRPSGYSNNRKMC